MKMTVTSLVRAWIVLMLFVFVGGMAWAASTDVPDEGRLPDASQGETKPIDGAAADHDRWYFFWGPANVHAKLHESESEINAQLNDTFGRIIPGWRRPTTFKDWSRDFKLYDFHFGIGRDLGPYFAWFVDAGGVLGTVRNKDAYKVLGIGLDSRINFERQIWFVAAGVDWYPWGKPSFARNSSECFIKAMFRNARPYIEGAVGHVHAREVADVHFRTPDFIVDFRQRQFIHHDVNYVSPRIGVELPVGKNDSIALQAGYLFFDHHSSDFNNASIYLQHHHKF